MKLIKMLFMLGLCVVAGYQIYHNLTTPDNENYAVSSPPQGAETLSVAQTSSFGFIPVPWIGGAPTNTVMIYGPT